MKGAPRSKQFDEFYFSEHDGLVETGHVFLKANNLPKDWEGKDSYNIFELGFGTGLNFLATWDLFEKKAAADQTLDYISVEKYPLNANEIKDFLSPWNGILGNKTKQLCDSYPIRVRGFHRIKISYNVTLTLIFDDANEVLPQLYSPIDCWFLDGFSPAKNPDMWTENIFHNIARLSKPNAKISSFTAASFVRKNLSNVGFDIQKLKGFRYKSDMIAGYFKGKPKADTLREKKYKPSIAIIGGGLSGTACAYVLKQYGYESKIYEASDTLASGASGNECGFYNPRVSALWQSESLYFSSAYAQFVTMAQKAGKLIDYNPCGALHVIKTEDKQRRFSSMLESWGWHKDNAKIINADEAREIAGIPLDNSCMYLPESGSVNTKKLCSYYAQDAHIVYNTKIQNIEDVKEDIVIICNAYSATKFKSISDEFIQTVRGQISKIKTTNILKNLRCNIHFNGYISAYKNGEHHTGATFQPWDNGKDIREEDNQRNVQSIRDMFGNLKDEDIEVCEGWAGLRTASKDHFPVVGRLNDNSFISLAYGAYGLVGSLQSAHIIADMIRGNELLLTKNLKKSLSYQRFIDRKKKKES